MACNRQLIAIEQEYARNANLKREDIKILRQFVETKYPETTDFHLFLFLHSCYYDIENAKSTIESYYKMQSNWPEVFKNRNSIDQLYVGLVWPLKQSTNEGYKIFYSKIMNSDPSQYDFEGQLKMVFVIFEFWLATMGNSDGFVIIVDADGLTWGHVPKFGVNASRKALAFVQEAFPLRLKAVCCINASPILEKLLNIVKVFMKKELYNLVHFFSDLESLYQYVPKHCLPKDYGGDDVTIQELHENMIDTLTNNPELFEVNEETTKAEKFTYLDDVF